MEVRRRVLVNLGDSWRKGIYFDRLTNQSGSKPGVNSTTLDQLIRLGGPWCYYGLCNVYFTVIHLYGQGQKSLKQQLEDDAHYIGAIRLHMSQPVRDCRTFLDPRMLLYSVGKSPRKMKNDIDRI